MNRKANLIAALILSAGAGAMLSLSIFTDQATYAAFFAALLVMSWAYALWRLG